jgi:hypothetical protein
MAQWLKLLPAVLALASVTALILASTPSALYA